jgi:ribonuclease HII
LEERYTITFDEVGRGALAGPVTICAVCYNSSSLGLVRQAFSSASKNKGVVKDSKKLTGAKRKTIARALKSSGIKYSLTSVSPGFISKYGMSRALKECILKSIQKLNIKDGEVKRLEFDGRLNVKKELPHLLQVCEDKLDETNIFCAGASVIAKVHRDKMMDLISRRYPDYGFEQNKGYGTKKHIEAIRTNGFSPVHRRNFIVKSLLPRQGSEYENLVCRILEKRGFEVIARNFFVKNTGEIDIVARKSCYLYFLEVKYRKNEKFLKMEETITDKKLNYIKKCAQEFVLQNNHLDELECKFLGVTIEGNQKTIKFFSLT